MKQRDALLVLEFKRISNSVDLRIKLGIALRRIKNSLETHYMKLGGKSKSRREINQLMRLNMRSLSRSAHLSLL